MKNDKRTSLKFLIIFSIFLIIVIAGSSMLTMSLMQVLSETQMLGRARWNGIGYLIFFLPVFLWACIFAPLPILWGLHRLQDRKLKKNIQKLEETICTGDKISCLQNKPLLGETKSYFIRNQEVLKNFKENEE
ncbi:hypothetical protein [Bartonella koehlerae]|uniref:hypothetical protein n=1 Tax=Bartonella koehlerae TaxID=92181 RepID=UPI001ABA1E96|nr:hypothetical protein [Bartonella koehlerae]